MKKIEVRRKIFPVLAWTGMTIWVTVFLLLLLWAAITSVKSIIDFKFNPIGFPKEEFGGLQFENYSKAWGALLVIKRGVHYRAPDMIVNSLIFATSNAFAAVLTACLASYILAKYSYIPWVKHLWVLVLITNYVPIGSSMASNIEFLTKLNLYNNRLGIVLWYCGAFGGTFLIYYATWRSVSWEYAEAAFVDGASHFRTMLTIMFPMTITVFGVLFLTKFVELWNDYQTSLIYLPSYPTLAYGAWVFQFSIDDPTIAIAPIQLAGLLTLSVPMLIVFLIFKDKLMGSLTMGGLKG